MRLKSWSSCTLLAALFLLFVALVAAVVWFALPREHFIAAGPLSDFKPSADPYPLDRGKYLFIVSDGESVLAIEPVSPEKAGCRAQWAKQEKVFIDPCSGAQFDLSGRPVKWAERRMVQYPVKVEDGLLWVDTSRTLQISDDSGE